MYRRQSVSTGVLRVAYKRFIRPLHELAVNGTELHIFSPFFLFIVARVLRSSEKLSSVEKSKFNLGERRKFEIRRDIWSPGGGASDGKIGRGENNLWANYSGE